MITKYILILITFVFASNLMFSQEPTFQAMMDSTNAYMEKQDFQTSLQWAKKAEAKAKAQFGVKDTNYIASLNSIYQCYYYIGNSEKAIEYCEKEKQIIKETIGENSENFADVLAWLGLLNKVIGNYEKAEQYNKEALELRRRLFKGDHLDLATSINNMAVFYNGRGRFGEAEPLYKEALEMIRRLFKGDHPDLAGSINNTATFYGGRGRYEEAEPLFLEALEMRRRLFKEDHPNLAQSINEIAVFYKDRGRYLEAEPLYKEALEMNRRLFKSDHPELATSINNMANFYEARGRFSDAEPLYKKALEMRRRLFKSEDPDLAQGINNLAMFYKDRGRFSDAEPLLKEALEMYRSLFKVDHPDIAISINNMAMFYNSCGRYAVAEPLLKEALEMKRRLFKADHPNLATSINNMAYFYVGRGRFTEAEPLFKEALEMTRRLFKTDHPYLAKSINNMALLYTDRGRYSEAELLFKEALEMTRRLFKADHPDLALNIKSMAYFYNNIKRFTEAEPLYKEALEMYRRLFNGDHPDLARTINSMAVFYNGRGLYSEAELLYIEALQVYFKVLANYFPSLSEKEKKQFWNTMSSNFENFNTFAVKRAYDNPYILGNIYDNQLVTKGLLFNSASNIKERIMSSGDSALIVTYKRWTDTKELLVKLYKMTNIQLKKNNFSIDSIEKVANDIEKDISLKSEPFAKSYEKKKVTWRSIQTLLKPDEAAVEIVRFRYYDKNRWTDTIYYAFLIITDKTTDHPELVLLENGKELDSSYYDQYRNWIKRKLPDSLSFGRYWSKIYEKLKVYKKIYLSPDGIYNKLNPGTFLLPNGKYLLEEQNIQIVNSTKDLLLDYFRSKQETNIYNSAALFGNPSFIMSKKQLQEKEKQYASKEEELYAESIPETIRSLNLVNLPGTEKEVKDIEKFLKSKKWDVKIFINDDAIKSALKTVNSPRVLHLATHGFFLPDVKTGSKELLGFETERIVDNPLLRSGIILAGASSFINDTLNPTGEDNGILTSYEAMNLNLDHTELVVLSACESGLGVVQNGEGVFGLRRAFQQAGARTVMMSLWTVSDEATQELMSQFYKNWVSGMTKREAFSKAQLEMMSNHPEPFYWGAFVMVGE